MNRELKALLIGATVWIGSITLLLTIILWTINISSEKKQYITVEIGQEKTDTTSNNAKPIIHKIRISNEDALENAKPSNKQNKEQHTEINYPENTLWIVQVGSYANKSYANKLMAILKKNNFQAILYTQKKQGKTLYAVRLKKQFKNKVKAQQQVQVIKDTFNIIPIIIHIN